MADVGFDPVLVLVRALHTGAAVVLFGELLFAASIVADRGADAARRRAVLAAAWVVAAVSAVAWLGLEASVMSGRGWTQAWQPRTLQTVLGETVFGRAWLVRGALLVALAATLVRTVRAGTSPRVAAVLAGAFLGGLAWAGHANVERGAEGVVHHVTDLLHLLAAGAWLGGLAPFAIALRSADAFRPGEDPAPLLDAVVVVRRYALLAVACVGVIAATGIANALFTVHAAEALLRTPYGRVLLVKLALFALLLGVAAANRWRLTPRLSLASSRPEGVREAAHALWRNAWIETGLGAAIVLAAAVLATSAPPMAP